MTPSAVPSIRSRPMSDCPQCGTAGTLLYEGLTDRLFSAPGVWNVRRCPAGDCGMLWLDPMPFEQDLDEAYRTYHTHRKPGDDQRGLLHRVYGWFKEGYFGDRFGYPVTPPVAIKRGLALLLHLAPDLKENLDLRVLLLRHRPNGRLLDVGCGDGHTLQFMREMGWRVEGVDFDPAAVEQARALGLDVRAGTLAAQRYPDASFDAVVVSHLVEHVPAPDDLLRECRRILQDGGQMTVVTPNAASYGHLVFRERWRGLEPPRHLQIFTPQALERATRRAGFSFVRVRTSTRIAAKIHQQSVAPERAADGTARSGWRDRAFSAFASVRNLFAPGGGEEIVLVARP